jgi:hypothetical protein
MPRSRRLTLQAIRHVLVPARRRENPRLPLHPSKRALLRFLERSPQSLGRYQRSAASRRLMEEFCPAPRTQRSQRSDFTNRSCPSIVRRFPWNIGRNAKASIATAIWWRVLSSLLEVDVHGAPAGGVFVNQKYPAEERPTSTDPDALHLPTFYSHKQKRRQPRDFRVLSADEIELPN